MWRYLSRLLLPLTLALLLLTSGCALLGNRPQVDFSRFTDSELPEAATPWLAPSPQTQVTERISREVAAIHGRNRRERLYLVMDHVWNTFTFNSWDNQRMFTRSADDLVRERTLGGCADYALVLATFFRAQRIPTRLVMTTSVEWLTAYRNNPLSMPDGHVLVEVYLEDHWALLDPTFRLLYDQYQPGQESYPGGQMYCRDGADYWTMAIRDVSQVQETMIACANLSQPAAYRAPDEPGTPL